MIPSKRCRNRDGNGQITKKKDHCIEQRIWKYQIMSGLVNNDAHKLANRSANKKRQENDNWVRKMGQKMCNHPMYDESKYKHQKSQMAIAIKMSDFGVGFQNRNPTLSVRFVIFDVFSRTFGNTRIRFLPFANKFKWLSGIQKSFHGGHFVNLGKGGLPSLNIK